MNETDTTAEKTQKEKAQDYGRRLAALLAEAKQDGLLFTATGGHRRAHKLTVTVLPQTFDLDTITTTTDQENTNG